MVESHNFGKNKKATLAVVNSAKVKEKRIISKNLTHRVLYNVSIHTLLNNLQHQSVSLRLLWKIMEQYLVINPAGKMLHDPLTACCAIDPSIATWIPVDILYEDGKWGVERNDVSSTFTAIDYDHERFLEMLCMS